MLELKEKSEGSLSPRRVGNQAVECRLEPQVAVRCYEGTSESSMSHTLAERSLRLWWLEGKPYGGMTSSPLRYVRYSSSSSVARSRAGSTVNKVFVSSPLISNTWSATEEEDVYNHLRNWGFWRLLPGKIVNHLKVLLHPSFF